MFSESYSTIILAHSGTIAKLVVDSDLAGPSTSRYWYVFLNVESESNWRAYLFGLRTNISDQNFKKNWRQYDVSTTILILTQYYYIGNSIWRRSKYLDDVSKTSVRHKSLHTLESEYMKYVTPPLFFCFRRHHASILIHPARDPSHLGT